MLRSLRVLPLAGLCTLVLAGCASSYSPNTYSSNAVQQANKVEPGVIVGFREVAISSNGSVGAVTGGAAGGVLGAQYADSALAAVGGTAVGLVVGSAIDHATGDTTGWEYIIRKSAGDMLSVTQKEKRPLALGQKVLVITGPQARVIPDYSVPPDPPKVAENKPADPKPVAENKSDPVKIEVVLQLPPGVSAEAVKGQTITLQPALATPAQAPTVAASATPASTPVAQLLQAKPASSALIPVSGAPLTSITSDPEMPRGANASISAQDLPAPPPMAEPSPSPPPPAAESPESVPVAGPATLAANPAPTLSPAAPKD